MRRQAYRSWSTLLAIGLCGIVLSAQAPSPQGAPGPQGAPAAPQKPVTPGSQQPTFRSSVDLVTTDVIVRDKTGQFVADLKSGDFVVYEDGVPQAINSMTLVHGGRAFNVQQPPPPPTAEGIILPASRPTNDAAGRIFVLLIDDLHLDFKNTPRVRDFVKKIKTLLFHPGDMFGIVSTGTSSIAIDLTYDLKRVDEAVKKIMGGALKFSEIIDGPEGQEGPSEVRYRAHVAFSTAADLLSQLERVTNRRKSLIYVSNGYDFNPFAKSRAGEADSVFQNRDQYGQSTGDTTNADGSENSNSSNSKDPTTRAGSKFAEADLVRELAELTRAANRANTTIYTFDTRGLVGMPDLDENVDPVEFQEYMTNSMNSLRVLSEQTGGTAVVNQNDLEKALKRIDAETSDYYMLGYYSSNPDPLRRTRQIDVKTARKDVDVWARKSYTLKRPGGK
jgi:VWFA-related protein